MSGSVLNSAVQEIAHSLVIISNNTVNGKTCIHLENQPYMARESAILELI